MVWQCRGLLGHIGKTVMRGVRYGADLLVAELKPGEDGLKACGPLGRVGSNPSPGARCLD